MAPACDRGNSLNGTAPMPGWVKAILDGWLQAANLTAGRLLRCANKNERAWGDGLTEKAVSHVVPRLCP